VIILLIHSIPEICVVVGIYGVRSGLVSARDLPEELTVPVSHLGDCGAQLLSCLLVFLRL
jgi:hypothetical protein